MQQIFAWISNADSYFPWLQINIFKKRTAGKCKTHLCIIVLNCYTIALDGCPVSILSDKLQPKYHKGQAQLNQCLSLPNQISIMTQSIVLLSFLTLILLVSIVSRKLDSTVVHIRSSHLFLELTNSECIGGMHLLQPQMQKQAQLWKFYICD